MRHGTWIGTTEYGMDVMMDDMDMATLPVDPTEFTDVDDAWGGWDSPETVDDE